MEDGRKEEPQLMAYILPSNITPLMFPDLE